MRTKHETLFLLEDDETLERGISMALTGPEISVTCRSTLAQAWEALAGERFDLLILDINLPDGSGLDLLRQVRTEGDATPVILLTANDMELDEVTGLEAGGGRLYHQALFSGGAPGQGERPAPPKRTQGLTGRVYWSLCL